MHKIFALILHTTECIFPMRICKFAGSERNILDLLFPEITQAKWTFFFFFFNWNRPKKDRRKIGPDLLLVNEGESTDPLILGAPTWLKLLSYKYELNHLDVHYLQSFLFF